ncbi:MAG: mandelate racemase/muconate lactonizing enzyme family protein [Planctomycetia bacterium]|nr:mandelate racemase/muconate lactonizing enzyme family protein [Planctomycetia bacterium]
MKITEVRAVQPIAAHSPPDWRTSMGQILVAIDTDCGLTGYGVGGGGLAGLHVVRTVLRDLLLGQSPEPVETRWQALYDATLPFGRKGLAIMALSGVDLALWDLRGKAERLPVARILNPRCEFKPLPTYGTVWDDVPPDAVGQYRAFKLHVGHQPTSDPVSATVGAVERARRVIGPACPLMLDAWMKWDLPTTLAVARQCAHLSLDWIEEPLPVDDLAGYARLRDECPIPIAGGEHEFTALGFQPLIEQRLHRVLQPDVCWCGGLTELVKIYRLANATRLRVCPHRGAEVWGLHAIAALDPQPLAESGRPWMTWVGGQPEIADGFIQLSDRVGFGVEIVEACLPIASGT